MQSIPLTVNGNSREIPLNGESSLGDLLDYLRNAYTSETNCISSIRIDGEEISESAEKALAPLPISELRSIEVSTAHPRELAQATLQDMIEFCEPLITRAKIAGEEFRADGHPSRDLASLVDGISTFIEALQGARQILNIRSGALPSVDLLEADLTSIMKDAVSFYEEGHIDYVAELLSDYLVKNLEEWRTDGVPALMRARDS
ncbi:MAG: hypothetical protein P4M08_15905 [Oligoflexia bacterium]|nr:hypothetical protein [Oligoflexia bacterium]